MKILPISYYNAVLENRLYSVFLEKLYTMTERIIFMTVRLDLRISNDQTMKK